MVEFKLNIGDPKSKKSIKREVKDSETDAFFGKKIGDKVKGDSFGLSGYEFEVTGGSDYTGVPMRKDVLGTQRQRILIVSGTGIRKNRKGRRIRKTMAGNTVYDRTAQINLKVLKAGKDSLFEEEKKEEPKPKEKAAETPKEETKPTENKEEAPAGEKKEEKPKEEKPAETPKKEDKKEEPSKEEKKAEDKPPAEEKKD